MKRSACSIVKRIVFSFLRIAIGVLVGLLLLSGLSSWFGVTGDTVAQLDMWRAKKTVADRLWKIRDKRPDVRAIAEAAGGSLAIFVFKNERLVEVCAPGWAEPRLYPMTGFSGRLGPKLREGDMQIPEGIYRIESLNPNSEYHLSLRVSYPNAVDRKRAGEDNRDHLGGDIMIHGGSSTIGCIPIGDENIEELFYVAASVGIKNIQVVIAPYDMRKGRRPELEVADPSWYPQLCEEIALAFHTEFSYDAPEPHRK